MEKSRILIADDHQLVIDGLETMIGSEDDLEVIATANNGKEALEKSLALHPDLILMDMDMPLLNGMEASRRILAEDKSAKIAVLSMYADGSLVKSLIQYGIVGYFLKNITREELLKGIRMILGGEKYYHPEVIERMLSQQPQRGGNRNEVLARLSLLSDREREVLVCTAEGLTSAETADRLFISPRTVETHRKNIHQKLEIKNLAGLIKFAIEAGLIN